MNRKAQWMFAVLVLIAIGLIVYRGLEQITAEPDGGLKRAAPAGDAPQLAAASLPCASYKEHRKTVNLTPAVRSSSTCSWR